jgi:hypothetical protein
MVLANTADHVGGVAIPTMHGFRVSFLIATAAVAVGLVLALLLPNRRPALTLRASGEGERAGKAAAPSEEGAAAVAR